METTTPLSNTQLQALLEIARDLTASLAAEDRYSRLLSVIRRLVPCDAACLLRLEGNELVPVAAHGLIPSALSRRFDRRDHPRLDVILNSTDPVQFPVDSPLADPFDGLLDIPDHNPSLHDTIHACFGCALTEGGEVVGALTADALEPHAFDDLDPKLMAVLGAMAGAAVRTTTLIETLRQRAEHRGRVAREVVRNVVEGGGEILGISPKAVRLREEIAIVASSNLAVLITGETGVGKELVARHIHGMSSRADEALIQVNCAALPETIAESELFGHVAGSFTGAIRDRAGKFEIADGGTLFLDEIGELPLTVQSKLLRALQQGEIQRVGSDRRLRVDVRILAATNADLRQRIAEGRFREDLYYRLNVISIALPPLRVRKEDIPALTAHFLAKAARDRGVPRMTIDDELMALLVRYHWPGNVRQLENVIARLGVLGSSPRLTLRDLEVDAQLYQAFTEIDVPQAPSPIEDLTTLEKRQIQRALRETKGNRVKAAALIGISRATIFRKIREYGIE